MIIKNEKPIEDNESLDIEEENQDSGNNNITLDEILSSYLFDD